MVYEDVLSEIRAQMGRRRMRPQDLSRATGITQGTVSRRLNGIQPFTVPELLTVCDVLDVRLDDLIAEARTHSNGREGEVTREELTGMILLWGMRHGREAAAEKPLADALLGQGAVCRTAGGPGFRWDSGRLCGLPHRRSRDRAAMERGHLIGA